MAAPELRMTAPEPEPAGAPIFVVGVARSGSTLLRYLLDAHPDTCCPAETNLALAFQAIFYSHSVACGAPSDAELWEPAAIESCRSLADETLGAAARRHDKPRWCDKSLSTIEQLDLVLKVFPEARVLSLVRRCRDVVISGLEACPWGLAGYGFEPFARENPTNLVLALVRCWVDRVERQLAAEKRYPDRLLRVAYETLVTESAVVVPAICEFLGLEHRPEYFSDSRVFDVPPTIGPEDHKISYTREIHRDSIGRGDLLPLENLVPPELSSHVAALEHELGLDRLDLSPIATLGDARRAAGANAESARHGYLAALIRSRFERAGPAMVRRISGERYPFDARIVVEDATGASAVRVANGMVLESGPTAAITLRVNCAVLDAVLDGNVSAADVARRMLILVENPDGTAADPAVVYAAVRTFLRVVSEPTAPRAVSASPMVAGALR